ncbi:uncharacterized protein BJ212DRAFT_1300088 [Suillus subaureus]|uniref:Uncharacterized protein n=1 Tax=Suillus subaureus TaxID=48587 RepID=A0A9P7E9S8_9AGAM|nr:uncharacterized protein BJ212DRAFT_1300088 [Suillus subaureus]KAG1815612.1 hypothetical protein BJ212DRAFT_1300088 [Suillus subaureus]
MLSKSPLFSNNSPRPLIGTVTPRPWFYLEFVYDEQFRLATHTLALASSTRELSRFRTITRHKGPRGLYIQFKATSGAVELCTRNILLTQWARERMHQHEIYAPLSPARVEKNSIMWRKLSADTTKNIPVDAVIGKRQGTTLLDDIQEDYSKYSVISFISDMTNTGENKVAEDQVQFETAGLLVKQRAAQGRMTAKNKTDPTKIEKGRK